MKVWLKNDWFSNDGTFYRKAHNPHEFDESLLPQLPSSAVVGATLSQGTSVKVLRKDPEPVLPPSTTEKELREKLAVAEAELEKLKAAAAKAPEPAAEPAGKSAELKLKA